MDELDLFREFRSGVVAPSEAAERRASVRLTHAIERPPGRGARLLRLVRQRPGRTTLALTVLAGAAVTALFVNAPWKSSPGFLERAEAALTPPPGSVLHMKWQLARTSTEFGCTVTVGPNEMWVDQTAPYKYRFVSHNSPLALTAHRRAVACTVAVPHEIGGTLGASIMFVPPDRFEDIGPGVRGPADFVADLREAIADGRAHHEGRVELNGRVVERIRTDYRSGCSEPPCPPHRAAYAYVEPETFRPVQIDIPYGYTIFPGPGERPLRFEVVERYSTYEYLPRTAANLALTDIRAQHPGATGP